MEQARAGQGLELVGAVDRVCPGSRRFDKRALAGGCLAVDDGRWAAGGNGMSCKDVGGGELGGIGNGI